MLEHKTTVATPRWVRAAIWLALPLIGAALLLLVARVAGWMSLPGPFALIRDLPAPVATFGAPTLGAVIGLVLAAFVDEESLTVEIDPATVILTRPGASGPDATRTVPKPDIAVAFPDRDRLVLLGRTGRELAREPSHLSTERLAAAFAAHGIPWAAQDPYQDAYRRWVPGLPDLPATAHALLTARQTAIRTGDEKDQRELRDELGRLGYVLRDDQKRQYWRRADG
ncbi:YqeB family protein [Micromonosporaceae bacterium Da 78-11]